MHKTILIILLSFLIGNMAIAQSKGDSVAYYMRDDYNMAKNKSDAQFLRLIIKGKGRLYNIEDYYPNGALRATAKSTIGTSFYQIGRQGLYTEFAPDGSIKFSRNYVNGIRNGDATTYYPNGEVYSVITYDGNAYYLKTCKDSTGKVLADNGNGQWIKLNDTLSYVADGPVVNGKEEGEWKGLNDEGEPGKEVYKKGEHVSGAYLTGDMSNQVFTAVQVPAKFGNGVSDLTDYIKKNMHYPKVALDNNVQGTVILTFVVEKDGSLTNITLLRGIGSGMDEEAIRLLQNCPKWSPGMQNGRPVRMQFSVPVKYELTDFKKF